MRLNISSKILFSVCWITKYDFTHTRNESLQTTLKVFFKKADGFKDYADLMECQGESESGLSAWATITQQYTIPQKISSAAEDQHVTVAKRESANDTATVLGLILLTELLTQTTRQTNTRHTNPDKKQQLKDG